MPYNGMFNNPCLINININGINNPFSTKFKKKYNNISTSKII